MYEPTTEQPWLHYFTFSVPAELWIAELGGLLALFAAEYVRQVAGSAADGLPG